VVLYDEYGGFFDHVPPPAAVPPDEHVSDAPRFGFDRLGCRVPAVLVSPRLARGAVDQTVYDHTSLLGSAKKMFDLPAFLTRRDAAAQTFEHHLSNAPRPIEETPRNLLGLVPAGATTGANHHRPVASYQRQLLALMSLGPHGNEDEAARSLREYIAQASEGVQSP
jgi:phospholipase C